MQVPAVNSPLSIIAIFVALIELFLAYPVTHLEGFDRSVVVYFMTIFPFFVASLFFYVIWHKPMHLYNPENIPSELYSRYQNEVAVAKLPLEIKLKEVIQDYKQLLERIKQSKESVPMLSEPIQFEQEINMDGISDDIKVLESEVRDRIKPFTGQDTSKVQQAKQEIIEARQKDKEQKIEWISKKMLDFREWLKKLGFNNLPDLPNIVLKSTEQLYFNYDTGNNTAYLGSLLEKDIDIILYLYFFSVLRTQSALSNWEGETSALGIGFSDYYICSYKRDPHFGEAIVKAMKETGRTVPPGLKRDLNQVVSLNEARPNPYDMSLVWSGACWELRGRHDAEKIDNAVRLILSKLDTDSTITQSAQILLDELVEILGIREKKEIQKVFQKRGVEIL